jgi:hypothetical protein
MFKRHGKGFGHSFGNWQALGAFIASSGWYSCTEPFLPRLSLARVPSAFFEGKSPLITCQLQAPALTGLPKTELVHRQGLGPNMHNLKMARRG